MKKKRDWAVRTAELSVGFQNERERVEWIVRALHRAEKRGCKQPHVLKSCNPWCKRCGFRVASVGARKRDRSDL
jgi:hypothetical protein